MVLYRPATTPGASPGFHAAKASTTVRAKTGGKTRVQAPTLSAARRGSVYKPVAGIPFRSMPAKSPEDPEEQTEMPEEEEEEPEEPQPEEPELEEPEAADFEELAEPEEVVEPEEELEEPIQESLPEEDAQDTDSKLHDPVEDLAHANQSSTRSMKSLMWSGSDVESVKRRRLIAPLAPLEPEKLTLLGRWHMASDRACRYVMQAASLEEVQTVRESGWRPAPVTAFVQKWALGAEEGTLRKANHKARRDYGRSPSVSKLSRTMGTLMTRPTLKMKTFVMEMILQVTPSWVRACESDDDFFEALTADMADYMDDGRDLTNAFVQPFGADRSKGRCSGGRRCKLNIFKPIGKAQRGAGTYGANHSGERYAEIDATVKELEAKDAEVFHNVDGTRLAVDPRFQEMQKKFGAVYYNFPHAGVVQGFFDGHPFVRWRHENLMHLFFRALRGFVKPQGARNSEFVHVETLPFQEWSLRGYRRSYGDRRDANRRPEENDARRLALQADDSEASVKWETKSLTETLQLVQVASMLQLEEMIPELINLVWQAMATGADVSELEDKKVHFYVSPFQRTLQTARNIIFSNFQPEQVVGVSVDPRIREQEFGNLQGDNFIGLREESTKIRRFWYRYPTGESGADGLANLLLHEEAQFAPFEMQRAPEPEPARTVTGVLSMQARFQSSVLSPTQAPAMPRSGGRTPPTNSQGLKSLKMGEAQSWWKRRYGSLNSLTEMLADDDAVMDRMQLPVQYALNP
eukprot:g11111.t1